MEASRKSVSSVPSCSATPGCVFAPSIASSSETSVWKSIKPFVNGGASGMVATCVIQPIDMVKVRIQLGAVGNPLSVGAAIAREEGFGALYHGLSAGLLRQATYTTARMGIFTSLQGHLKQSQGLEVLPLWQKAASGLTAGGLGALVGTPSDLSLVRMQADATLPVAERRNYKGVFDALTRITREEGVSGLFKGAGPTVVRAMALNMGMLASNEQARELIAEYGGYETGSAPVVLGGSMIAGFFAAACSLPFDFVKTRMQKMAPNPDGTLPYKGPIDCATQTFQKEGFLKFYTGFPTYCIRIAPHVVITLVILDIINATQKNMGI